jgi:hypothetical protein
MVSKFMMFPLDMDTLSVLLAATAIILLITSELLSSSHHGITFISRKKLRQVAVVFSIAFIVTVATKIINILWTSF